MHAPVDFSKEQKIHIYRSAYGYHSSQISALFKDRLSQLLIDFCIYAFSKNSNAYLLLASSLLLVARKIWLNALPDSSAIADCAASLIFIHDIDSAFARKITKSRLLLKPNISKYVNEIIDLRERWNLSLEATQAAPGPCKFISLSEALETLSKEKLKVAYTFRGAGFYSELLSIVDTISFCVIYGLGFVLKAPKTIEPSENHYFLAFARLIAEISTIDLTPKDCYNSLPFDFETIHSWQRTNNYLSIQKPPFEGQTLFMLRSQILNEVFPRSNLISFLNRYIKAVNVLDLSPYSDIRYEYNSVFLRFGDKLKSESIDLTNSQIASVLLFDSPRRHGLEFFVLSDDNSRVEDVLSLSRKKISRPSCFQLYLHYRGSGYSNSSFKNDPCVIESGFANIIYNVLVLSGSCEFWGDPFCNLVNAAALYNPTAYRPSLIYPFVPL